MTTGWRARLHIARRRAIGLAILGLLGGVCAGGAVWRASSIINRLLREWVTGTIAQQSAGVYQVDLSRVRFDWLLRRVTVDSISLATRRGFNTRRLQALPGLRLALYGCTISGVHFLTLVRNAGLIASSFGCRSGSLMVEVQRRVRSAGPGGTPAPAEHGLGDQQPFLVFQQSVKLPSYAPRIRIAQVSFPRLALDVRLPRTASGAIRLELERLEWNMEGLVIDPTDSTAASRPLFCRTIELIATNFMMHPDPRMTVRVGLLRTSLTDSTLEVRGVAFAPIGSGAEFTRSRRQRHDLIRLSVGHITAQGIDFGAFVVGQGVRARRIEVDSFRIAVTSDKRRPEGPAGSPNRTPQQWIADLDEDLSLDSLRVRNGTVIYREHAAGRTQAGVLAFTRIEVGAADVRHFVGRRTSVDPMTLSAEAYLQDVGRFDVRFVVPLDAPRFDLSFRGALGAMPASAFNPFLVETQALRIENGHVAGVAFSAVVKNGVTSGTITPRFTDLSLSVTRSGSEGILGSGGIVGGAARGIATFASHLAVRANNPDSPGKAPRSGAISHTFVPDETLIAFLWAGVRDGLVSVVRK